MSDISYPGVYIEELPSTVLSVSTTATAVPVFAFIDDNPTSPTPVTRINSWLDFLNFRGENGIDYTNKLDVSIRTYFDNGGGYCYLVPTVSLTQEVPKLDDVTLLIAAGENIDSEVESLCEDGKTLFAILDGPNMEPESVTPVAGEGNKYAAIYYPWLTAPWAGSTDIPPSAVVAGAYCLNDHSRGVWKAPANMALRGNVSPKFKVTDEFQGEYTSINNAMNMIRQFNNDSPLIWGARTCAAESDEWRYVPVRRLFNSVEKDIKGTMQSMMFEPNNQPTWERVRAAINNYLYGLWRQGGLAGIKPEEAYRVWIGLNETMTQDDITNGKMIVKVGMAAVRPAEFIILQFTQDVVQ